MYRLHSLIALLALPVLASAQAPPELTRREKGNLAIQARAILRKHCYECHGGAASRGTIAVLDHPKLIATGPNPVPFVAPGNATGSQIVQFIEDGSMPPGGRARPTLKEIATLNAWVTATAPSYPAAFDERGTLAAMLDDIARQSAEDAPHFRYLSLAHLVREDTPLPDLNVAEFALQKAFAACGVRTPPVPVDDSATLFRFDTRMAGWDNRELFYRVTKGAPASIHPLTPYDLLLLECPHGASLAPNDPQAKRLDDYFAKAKLAHPVPFLRADWVSSVLSLGSPLADDMKSLGELGEALKKQGNPALGMEEKMPCGPASRAFGGRNPVPAAPKPEALRPILPLSSWYTGDSQTDPPSFNITAEVVSAEGAVLKTISKNQPFKLRLKSSQKVYFTLLMVWADGTVVVQPTNKGGFLEAGENSLTPKNGESFKITEIITGEPRATEYFVLLASTAELPQPILLQSRHSKNQDCLEKKRFPISRFVFDADAKFDSAQVVRKVIPITVTAGKAD